VPISMGIPAIAIGAGGRGGDAHTPGEWYDNVDGPLGIARAMTILVTAADLVGA
jgi:tripeptide aminopeptidase